MLPLVSVLLSASGKRVGVSRMRDYSILEGSGPQGRGPGGADGGVQEPNMLLKKGFYDPKGPIKIPEHF